MTKLYHKHCFGFVTLNIGLTRKCLFYRKLLVVIPCGLRIFLFADLFANTAVGIIVIWIVAFRKRILLFNCDFIIIRIFNYSSNIIIFHKKKYLFLLLFYLWGYFHFLLYFLLKVQKRWKLSLFKDLFVLSKIIKLKKN